MIQIEIDNINSIDKTYAHIWNVIINNKKIQIKMFFIFLFDIFYLIINTIKFKTGAWKNGN